MFWLNEPGGFWDPQNPALATPLFTEIKTTCRNQQVPVDWQACNLEQQIILPFSRLSWLPLLRKWVCCMHTTHALLSRIVFWERRNLAYRLLRFRYNETPTTWKKVGKRAARSLKGVLYWIHFGVISILKKRLSFARGKLWRYYVFFLRGLRNGNLLCVMSLANQWFIIGYYALSSDPIAILQQYPTAISYSNILNQYPTGTPCSHPMFCVLGLGKWGCS